MSMKLNQMTVDKYYYTLKALILNQAKPIPDKLYKVAIRNNIGTYIIEAMVALGYATKENGRMGAVHIKLREDDPNLKFKARKCVEWYNTRMRERAKEKRELLKKAEEAMKSLSKPLDITIKPGQDNDEKFSEKVSELLHAVENAEDKPLQSVTVTSETGKDVVIEAPEVEEKETIPPPPMDKVLSFEELDKAFAKSKPVRPSPSINDIFTWKKTVDKDNVTLTIKHYLFGFIPIWRMEKRENVENVTEYEKE